MIADTLSGVLRDSLAAKRSQAGIDTRQPQTPVCGLPRVSGNFETNTRTRARVGPMHCSGGPARAKLLERFKNPALWRTNSKIAAPRQVSQFNRLGIKLGLSELAHG